MNGQWLELARRVTADERLHRKQADDLWRLGDVIPALREKGIAEGLEMAREHHLAVVAEGREAGQPSYLESAMHSVWLHGDWRYLTSKMTAEEREAAAVAVQRYSTWLNRQDPSLTSEVLDLRWWQDGAS